jgi:4-hydroxythreonine-4-phosphate dehydrogenase
MLQNTKREGSVSGIQSLIAVAIGDPAGVGPEISVKALQTGEPQKLSKVMLIGNLDSIEDASRTAGCDLKYAKVSGPEEARTVANGYVPVFDDSRIKLSDYEIGKPSKAGGSATLEWIRHAVRWGEAGAIDGFIIAPVDSDSFKLAGIKPPIKEMHPDNTYLLRVAGKIRMIPIGEHVMMRDVPAMVTQDAVLHVIRLIGDSLQRWGFVEPKIAVAGLNPHAAGIEDKEEIAPAVAKACSLGYRVTGPLSPDAVFRQASQGEFDVVVAMYHDQGQIAIKTGSLSNACSIFVGLPYVRVGVPHGSAMGIAGKNLAQHGTMLTSIHTAASLVSGKGL